MIRHPRNMSPFILSRETRRDRLPQHEVGNCFFILSSGRLLFSKVYKFDTVQVAVRLSLMINQIERLQTGF